MAKTDVTLTKGFVGTSTTIDAAGNKATAGTVGTVGNYVYQASGAVAQNITVGDAVADHAWNITGTAAADTITGGNKADTLISGAGNDTLVGGAGKDVFENTATSGAAVVLSDYTYGEDSVYIGNSNTNLQKADVANVITNNDAFTSAGAVTTSNGTFDLTKSQTVDGYYKVTVTDGTDSSNVWFSGSKATYMDATSESSKLIMLGTNNTTNSDTIIGGSASDTIVAGANDYVYGGAGDDLVIMGSLVNVTAALASTGGKDTVKGFKTGTTAGTSDVVYAMDTTLANLAAKNDSAGNITITDGSGSLIINGTAGQQDLRVLDTTGKTYNVAIAETDTKAEITVASMTTYDALVGSYANKTVANFSSATASTDLVIDLGNTGSYNTAITYYGMAGVVGGKGNNTLIGAAATAETITGGAGASSLWGGGSANDTLVAGSATNDFFYGAGDGNDVIKGFTSSTESTKSTLTVLSGSIADYNRTSANLTLTWNDGGTLTLQDAESVDTAISYVDGGTTYEAKVGLTGKANTFTYNSAVEYFDGSTAVDTLNVTDGDNDKIWLDGSQNQVYASIDVINAQSATGDIQLAGSTSSNTIYGGKSSSSLWGGAGAVNDTLVGGSGEDSFFFGKGEGSDLIMTTTTADKVVLYNVASTDVTTAAVSGNSMVIGLSDGSTLTIANYGSSSVNQFQLTDGTCTYSTSTKKFTKNA